MDLGADLLPSRDQLLAESKESLVAKPFALLEKFFDRLLGCLHLLVELVQFIQLTMTVRVIVHERSLRRETCFQSKNLAGEIRHETQG